MLSFHLQPCINVFIEIDTQWSDFFNHKDARITNCFVFNYDFEKWFIISGLYYFDIKMIGFKFLSTLRTQERQNRESQCLDSKIEIWQNVHCKKICVAKINKVQRFILLVTIHLQLYIYSQYNRSLPNWHCFNEMFYVKLKNCFKGMFNVKLEKSF